MRKFLLGSVSLLALCATSLSSQAADLAVRKAPAYKAPAIVAPVISPWTGLYAGWNLGYGWERFGDGNLPRVNTGDGVFGAQVGYNWQAGSWVYGIEGDLQTTFQHVGTATGTCIGISCRLNARLNGFGTIRGRVGSLIGPGLLYVTGGAAFMNIAAELQTPFAITENTGTWRTGYAVGAGYEQMLWDRWSGKLEYLYMAAKGPSLTAGAVTGSADLREHLLRVGINYHF
jgi:outer membrane immunogenic protein